MGHASFHHMDGCKQVGIEWNGTDPNTTHTPCVRRCCDAKLAIILEGDRACAVGAAAASSSSRTNSSAGATSTERQRGRLLLALLGSGLGLAAGWAVVQPQPKPPPGDAGLLRIAWGVLLLRLCRWAIERMYT